MTQQDVVVYGASGYTGKLIAESLHERGIPFVAAGRNPERIAAALEIVAQRAGAKRIDASIVGVAHDEAALTAARHSWTFMPSAPRPAFTAASIRTRSTARCCPSPTGSMATPQGLLRPATMPKSGTGRSLLTGCHAALLVAQRS